LCALISIRRHTIFLMFGKLYPLNCQDKIVDKIGGKEEAF
jgi:hypothetical protein